MAGAGKPNKLGIEFTPEVYKAAALEHAGAVQGLYDDRQYTLAIFVAGLAVESMFRAYRMRVSAELDARHDLYELARISKFADRIPEASHESYAANLGIVATRWSNSHRYRSEEAIRKYLKRAKLDRAIKGDPLKENARLVVNAAIELVTLGAQRWKP